MWQGLREGEIGLSEVAASRLRSRRGDTVELPTVDGPKQLPGGRDLSIHRWSMTPRWATSFWSSEGLARTDWAAVRDQVAVDYPSAAEATAHRDDFLNLGAGLSVYDNEQWRSVAAEVESPGSCSH